MESSPYSNISSGIFIRASLHSWLKNMSILEETMKKVEDKLLRSPEIHVFHVDRVDVDNFHAKLYFYWNSTQSRGSNFWKFVV